MGRWDHLQTNHIIILFFFLFFDVSNALALRTLFYNILKKGRGGDLTPTSTALYAPLFRGAPSTIFHVFRGAPIQIRTIPNRPRDRRPRHRSPKN
jgi:hypothetical protein